MFAECILNNNTYTFALVEKEGELKISLDVVMGLIAQHRLNVKSFEKGKDAFTKDGTVKEGEKFTSTTYYVLVAKPFMIKQATCIHGGASIS